MTQLPPLVLLVFWALWVTQAALSAVKVRKFAKLYDRPAREPFERYRPPAVVVVPFKGIDTDLAGAVRALCEQDYPGYQLLLVVEDQDDPAHGVLTEQLKQYPHRDARVLVAGRCGPDEGQKVHNQLFAIDLLLGRADAEADPDEVWVFADSDAVPDANWLGRLVGPLLQADHTAVTTGYRWLIPAQADTTNPPTVWSHLTSVMNSSVACLNGHDRWNHAWGGSMALLGRTAREGGLRQLLTGALCDDYQFSRLARALGRRVYFVPQCLVATPVAFHFKSMVNFAHRQYLLTRVYAPKLYALAIAFTSFYLAGLVSAWGWLVAGLWRGGAGAWLCPAGAIVAVFVANQLRSGYRRRVVEKAFGPDTLTRLKTTLRWDRWATPLWMTLHWLLIVRSGFGRTMKWRGIRYCLYTPQRCVRLTGSS